MKAILLFSILAIGITFAQSAGAGAATGMPSPFMPPYPDFGYCGRCHRHIGTGFRYHAVPGYALGRGAHFRANDRARK